MKLLLILAWITTKGSAQELFVFSEVALLAESNRTTPDCAAIPRWSAFAPLSPAVPRGGRLSFVLAVAARGGQPFLIRTGQYPPDALALKMYRWFPAADHHDEPIAVPAEFRGRVGEAERCALFFLEAEVPPQTPPGRLKLEAALWVPDSPTKDFWIRYPMEVRVADSAVVNPKTCPAFAKTLQGLLLRNLAGLLGECPTEADLPSLAGRITALRRQQGKNQ